VTHCHNVLNDGVDDMHDAVAGQDVKLEHAGLCISGPQLAARLEKNDRQLLPANRGQRRVSVCKMLLLKTQKVLLNYNSESNDDI
jgi:type IV secretory pathway protease TraF